MNAFIQSFEMSPHLICQEIGSKHFYGQPLNWVWIRLTSRLGQNAQTIDISSQQQPTVSQVTLIMNNFKQINKIIGPSSDSQGLFLLPGGLEHLKVA